MWSASSLTDLGGPMLEYGVLDPNRRFRNTPTDVLDASRRVTYTDDQVYLDHAADDVVGRQFGR